MARTKKIAKAKEPVTLRYKELAKGNKSLYLDIYRDGARSYEFLKLYLIPEKTPEDKLTNETTLRAANAIKAERTRQIINGTAGIKDLHCRILLVDFMQRRIDQLRQMAEEKGRSEYNSANQVKNATLHLKAYIRQKYGNKSITLKDVDKTFCVGFGEYLCAAKGRKNKYCPEKPLSQGSREIYFKALSTALNIAVRDGLIVQNPMHFINRVQVIGKLDPTERVYLTADELRKLIATDCRREDVRNAFLFSCMCGLRWSDINGLKWADIHTDGDDWRVEKRMIKTRELLYLPLSEEAKKYLPDREDKPGEDHVFKLPTLDCAEVTIDKWIKDANINKHVTFHCARHTFATLMLTQGADLYTTSKLLGHTDIRNTQIYAKIVDEKKTQAVNLLNGIFEETKNEEKPNNDKEENV